MMDDNPINLRLLALRSFGESLYHSVTDACLEDGYKNL
jgi:sarcosine oxidase subunit gamma